MVFGLCLLPFAIIALPFIWLGKKTKVVSETNDIYSYVKNNPMLGNDKTKLKNMTYVPKSEYLGFMLVKRYFSITGPTSIQAMTLEEATKHLNHCVKDLESEVRVLFGYNQKYDAWFVLFPSPIPQFATSTLHDVTRNNTGGSEDPLHYKYLSNSYSTYMREYELYKSVMTKDFYVPAEQCEIYYEPFKKHMEFVQNHNVSTLINLAELDAIYLMDNSMIKQLSVTAVKTNTLLVNCMKNAIGLSYYLPLMYFNTEMARLMVTILVVITAHYKRLRGAYEYFPNHQESLIRIAESMATNSHFKDGARIYNDILANRFKQV